MAIFKVRKRNGAIVTFDRQKIEDAIKKAIEASGGNAFNEVPALTDEVVAKVDATAGKNIPDIEMIQDKVESVLIKH